MKNLDITEITQNYLNELYAQQDRLIGRIEGARELHDRIRKEIHRSELSGTAEEKGISVSPVVQTG